VALDDDGRVRQRTRVPAPRGDYQQTLDAIVRLVRELERSAGVTASVGVGIPGVISPATGLVKNANSTWLIGRRLREDLTLALGRPVRLENDANCFALSEATDGAGTGHDVVFGVILGTGTGGGIVVRGRALSGANAIAGEWGHNPLPWPHGDEFPGAPCYCGQLGCIETFLCGEGLVRTYRESGGGERTAQDVAAASAADPMARAAIDLYASRLARALASVINVLDPDVIVLGGGLSNIEALYERAPALWSTWVFSDRVDTRLARARHGDSSGVRGAAWLWND